MPATLKRLYLGTMPKGVSSPCGLVTVTTEPTGAPSWSAMSLPRMIGGSEAGGELVSSSLGGAPVADCVRLSSSASAGTLASPNPAGR